MSVNVKQKNNLEVGVGGANLKRFLGLAGGAVDLIKKGAVLGVMTVSVIHFTGITFDKEKLQLGVHNQYPDEVIKESFTKNEFRDFVSSFKVQALGIIKENNEIFKELKKYNDILSASGYYLNEPQYVRENTKNLEAMVANLNKDIEVINRFIVDGEKNSEVLNKWFEMYHGHKDHYKYFADFKEKEVEFSTMLKGVKDFEDKMNVHLENAFKNGFNVDASLDSIKDGLRAEVGEKQAEISGYKDMTVKNNALTALGSLTKEAMAVVERDAVEIKGLLKEYQKSGVMPDMTFKQKIKVFSFYMQDKKAEYQYINDHLWVNGVRGKTDKVEPYSLSDSSAYLSKQVPIYVNTFNGIDAILSAENTNKYDNPVRKVAMR